MPELCQRFLFICHGLAPMTTEIINVFR
jgi:hypothetical protein